MQRIETVTKLHENNTSAKQISDGRELPKTVFAREAEPLGLSLCKGPRGVALCKGGQVIEFEDAFPEHYTDAARLQIIRFGKAWLGHIASNLCGKPDVLRQLYEALGAIAYRIQFPERGRSLWATTRGVIDYFLDPDGPVYDRRGNQLTAAHWRVKAGLGTQDIELFAGTARAAAVSAEERGETGAAIREAVLWLALLHKMAGNPHRQKDANNFAEFCVRKIQERAGVQR